MPRAAKRLVVFWTILNITRGIIAKYHYKSCYYVYKSHNSLRTNTLPRPMIRAGKILIYANTVQSQFTYFASTSQPLHAT